MIGLGRALARVALPTLAGWVLPCAGLVVHLSVLFDGIGGLKDWHDRSAEDFMVKRAAPPAR